MSNVVSEKPTSAAEVEAQQSNNHVYDVDEKVDYNRAGAIEAEQLEHRMGVLEAVKAYPAASWWAFVMSATIVSLSLWAGRSRVICLTVNRSWSRTVFS